MNICVFGAASDKIDEKYKEAVFTLGEKIAERGHSLVFGAGGVGLMGAAARGVYTKGGKIYGVIPRFFIEEGVEPVFKNCTEMIYTDTMRERKATMEEMADAFLIVPGGIGTYEEFFEILTLKQLGRHSKPIALYNFEGYYDGILESLNEATEKKFIPEPLESLYIISEDIDKILSYIEEKPEVKYTVKELKN